jgi:PAS domain-containing protein
MERQARLVCRSILAQSPSPYLVLSPDLRIVEANPAYLAATRSRQEALAGLDVFDAFPDNPDDAQASGVRNLGASFGRALSRLQRDEMPVQRYDVRDERGVWEVRWWKPANWPVLDDDGAVIAVVHHVLDVTGPALAPSGAAPPLDLLARAEVALECARRERHAAHRDRAQAAVATRALLGGRRGGA